MNKKTEIVEAILKVEALHCNKSTLRTLLYNMSFTSLVCLAIELGIDTDSILTKEVA